MDAKLQALTSTFIDHAQGMDERELSGTVREFVAFLAQENMLGEWREVERAIHLIWKQKFGLSKMTIVSAHPLSEEVNATIEQMAHGADIERRVDERLIGGAIIRMDDRRVDGSIAGALQKLKMTLSK